MFFRSDDHPNSVIIVETISLNEQKGAISIHQPKMFAIDSEGLVSSQRHS